MATAQSELATQITRLRDMPSSGDTLGQAQAQQYNLSRLQSRIANADATTLGSIRGEIAATVVAAQSLVQQAQSGSALQKEGQAALYQATEAAHHTTENFMRDYYEKREFDPYLRFSSQQDEEEFRKREQDRREAAQTALAEHTPEGELRANRLLIEQLKDAGAHGATRSPDYKRKLDGLIQTGDNLKGAISANAEEVRETATTSAADLAQSPKIDPTILASLRSAGVSVPDQGASGHGVTANKPASPAAGISQR